MRVPAFRVGRSSLRREFVDDLGQGLFSNAFLCRGRSLFPLKSSLATCMNDADMDLSTLLLPPQVSALEFEQRLDVCKNVYERSNLNNAVVVGAAVQAARDIEAGEEVTRKYGWHVWVQEIAAAKGILRVGTFPGECQSSLSLVFSCVLRRRICVSRCQSRARIGRSMG